MTITKFVLYAAACLIGVLIGPYIWLVHGWINGLLFGMISVVIGGGIYGLAQLLPTRRTSRNRKTASYKPR